MIEELIPEQITIKHVLFMVAFIVCLLVVMYTQSQLPEVGLP